MVNDGKLVLCNDIYTIWAKFVALQFRTSQDIHESDV